MIYTKKLYCESNIPKKTGSVCNILVTTIMFYCPAFILCINLHCNDILRHIKLTLQMSNKQRITPQIVVNCRIFTSIISAHFCIHIIRREVIHVFLFS